MHQVRDTPPHYMWVGAGSPVRSFQSQDLLHWTDAEVSIAARPGMFDPHYTEAGAPPLRLADVQHAPLTPPPALCCAMGTTDDDCVCVGTGTGSLRRDGRDRSEPVIMPSQSQEMDA